jgi:EXPERA (EXPanded EBP superfamily)
MVFAIRGIARTARRIIQRMSTTSARLPSQADQDAPLTVPIPLRERPRDWFFVVIFSIFGSTSALIDTANTVGRPNPHSRNTMARFVYEHVGGIDPVLIANPRFVQVTVGFISAMLFGAFYLVLIYAFVRGREWIRLPAIFYAGMVAMGTAVYLGAGILGDAPLFALACGPGSGFDYKAPSALTSIAVNGPYPLVGLLLVARMWRPHPFTRRAG